MDLKPGKWKLNFRGGKDKWLVVLAVGLIFLILAFPSGGKSGGNGMGKVQGNQTGESQTGQNQVTGGSWGQNQGEWNLAGNGNGQETENGRTEDGGGKAGIIGSDSQTASSQSAAAGNLSYERQLEERLKELLSHVEGVGQVEVMIVLKSSEEKVWRVDRNTSYSSTQETDSNGGTRDIRSQEMTEGTILSGQGGEEGPLLEKEMRPEISGVVVTASGGGSPTVQAEISAAVEALFDVPSHKIKVLKRAE